MAGGGFEDFVVNSDQYLDGPRPLCRWRPRAQGAQAVVISSRRRWARG